ncbi:nucleotide exchange factor GrpE [Alphaproteobacteria bacterium]|nr:nucleotide exchange factor GrpE [Alphaproteobacteria bacterium]
MNEENNNKAEEQDLETPPSETKEQAPEQEQETEEVETSEDIIAKLNEEISNLKDQRLRAIAELENFRKRAEKDQSDALKYGVSNFAKEIINISDNIERAQSSIPEEAKNNETIKPVIEGIDLIAQSVVTTFEKIGIKKIESLNEKFDHNLHQAMMEIEKDDLEPGTIVQELIPGYTLHDRLLRPAMVGVSKKPKKNDDIADKPLKDEVES